MPSARVRIAGTHRRSLLRQYAIKLIAREWWFVTSLTYGLLLTGNAFCDDRADAARDVRQIIAHRGASAERPECTLSAIQRAFEVGATAVEMDVRTSKDGQLFLMHDATLDRTTNGSGAASALTLAQLQQLDAGSWFSPEYRQERIPTLRDALRTCHGKIDVLLDLKEQGADYTRAVARQVREQGEPERTIVGVRSVVQAKEIRRLLPNARQLGLIPGPEDIDSFAAAKVEMIRLWPHWLEKNGEELVHKVREAGTRLHLNGTTGSVDETQSLLRYHPDSLSSDDPARLIRTLREITRSAHGPSPPSVTHSDRDELFLIAHRGGVVDETRMENNLPAIEEAIKRGYFMLEVDIRESKDGHLVVHHDEDFKRFYDDERLVANMKWPEIKQLRSTPGSLRPIDFGEFASACRAKIRLMLDTKSPDHDEAFYSEMLRVLRENELLESALVIGTDQSKRVFKGRAKLGVNRTELRMAVEKSEDVSELYFLFEHGQDLDAETVKLAQEHDVLVVPSVNVFHYSPEHHHQLARADISRLKKLGVTYFQIDSVYEQYCRTTVASHAAAREQ